LPGISEVGYIPDVSPPALLVRFDPEQTSAEAIAEQAKIGLESDFVVRTTFAISFVTPKPELLAIPVLNPVRLFDETDLFVKVMEPGKLSLSNYIFGCGTCINSTLNGIPKLAGVLAATRENAPGGTPVAIVTFDPQLTTAEVIANATRDILETDELLGTVITIHIEE
jgi:hypothetical protein